MPFRHPMYRLLHAQREQDATVREVLDEAKAKAALGLERRGEPLKTMGWFGRTPSPLTPTEDTADERGAPAPPGRLASVDKDAA